MASNFNTLGSDSAILATKPRRPRRWVRALFTLAIVGGFPLTSVYGQVTDCTVASFGEPCANAGTDSCNGTCDSAAGTASGLCDTGAPAGAGVLCTDTNTTDCDLAACNGTGTCTQDQLDETTSYVCRVSAGVCDVVETCNAGGGSCPADLVDQTSFVCGSSTGECDPQEVCDGTDVACPTDTFATGLCCEANGSIGCQDETCCYAVCAVDSFCCTNPWDATCAAQAIDLCDVCATSCGDGTCDPDETCETCQVDCCPTCGFGAGNCCTDTATAGCETLSCCDAVCAVDSYCCDTDWDANCSQEAVDLCPSLICGGACCVADVPPAGAGGSSTRVDPATGAVSSRGVLKPGAALFRGRARPRRSREKGDRAEKTTAVERRNAASLVPLHSASAQASVSEGITVICSLATVEFCASLSGVHNGIGTLCSEVGICPQPVCGNDVQEFGESCDDGGIHPCGPCNANCTDTGTGSLCGDGVFCPDTEVCDDGDAIDNGEGGCIADCSAVQICGNSVTNGTEFCDDGDAIDNGEGGCIADCSAVQTCGNSVTNGTEFCDDGDTIDNGEGGCIADCSAVQTCGNSVTNGTEACDDGEVDVCVPCNADCTSVVITGLDEYKSFPDCLLGPDVAASVACDCFDTDVDGDVDMDDFASFQNGFSP